MTKSLTPVARDFLGRLQQCAGRGAVARGESPEAAVEHGEAIKEAFKAAMLDGFIVGIRDSYHVCDPFEPCLVDEESAKRRHKKDSLQEAMFT